MKAPTSRSPACEQTQIYAAVDQQELEAGQDRLGALADGMSRTEAEVPSIDTPLAHETEVEADHDLEPWEPERESVLETEPERDLGWEL